MAELGKVCPQLEEVWVGENCWGEGADEKDGWRSVLNSGFREGREMRRVWLKMRMDAESCTNYLEGDLPAVLATPLLGLGSGSVNGSTRSKVVEVMEQVHAKVLNKVLEAV